MQLRVSCSIVNSHGEQVHVNLAYNPRETSDRWEETRTAAGVIATLRKALLVAVHGRDSKKSSDWVYGKLCWFIL